MALLSSSTLPEPCDIVPTLMLEPLQRSSDGESINRTPSPNENEPPLNYTPSKSADAYSLIRSPLSDITRLRDIISVEACLRAARPGLDMAAAGSPASTDNPENAPLSLQPFVTKYSGGTNSEEPIPPFDPFFDDPEGPTQHLPPTFQGPLSELWPRKSAGIFLPDIISTLRELSSSTDGISSYPFYAGSTFYLSRMESPKPSPMENLELSCFLPSGLLNDAALWR